MQLEATGQPIRYRLKTGEKVTLRPGVPMELPDQAATQLLQKAPAMVRRVDTLPVLTQAPVVRDRPHAFLAPLHPGWLVVYRDQRGTLCGGCDDRARGTVQACQWTEPGWTVMLTDGQRLPFSLIRAVGQTDATGRLIAAWTVREHGCNGKGELHGIEYSGPA